MEICLEKDILDWLWQNNTEELPMTLFSSLPQVLSCRFLDMLVLHRGYLLYRGGYHENSRGIY